MKHNVISFEDSDEMLAFLNSHPGIMIEAVWSTPKGIHLLFLE